MDLSDPINSLDMAKMRTTNACELSSHTKGTWKSKCVISYKILVKFSQNVFTLNIQCFTSIKN